MELPIFNTYMNFFLPSFLLLSQLFLCLFWISLWLRIGVYNTRDQYWVNGLKFTPVHIVRALSFLFFSCLQHPFFKKLCKIAEASKNSDANAQHFLSDSLKHS
jgi:hypothetical protein